MVIIKVLGHQHQWFPGVGGYNVKLYISRVRLAWWLLAFLHSDYRPQNTMSAVLTTQFL